MKMPRKPNSSPQTLALLVILLESPGSWRHGYELAQATQLLSGTLYPLLMRLADQEILETRWDIDGVNRRPRHVYRLSTSGVAYAKTQVREAAKRSRKSRLASATI